MGQEISTFHFSKDDFIKFKHHLHAETEMLQQWFDDHNFSNGHGVGGFELEAWIIDKNAIPLPVNEQFLKLLNDPLVGAELSSFNIELNTVPHSLQRNCLRNMFNDLAKSWTHCVETAEQMGLQLVMIGILPTVANEHLIPANMSQLKRYRALNDQIMLQRNGEPIHLEIEGRENLHIQHGDVMLEAATTSFQVQFQVDIQRSARFFNASLLLSAPLVAISANSPFMFGKDLWAETRIPVFEQSIKLFSESKPSLNLRERVTFGSHYASDSILELFHENDNFYPTLLPMCFDEDPCSFSHLRLHNGTIWRWNRPLIGFDANNAPHLRIEQRTISAGPTIVDSIANAALFFGLIEALGSSEQAPESLLAFDLCRDNFYAAAKNGLYASITWIDGKTYQANELICRKIISLAQSGLEQLGIDSDDIHYYLGIIEKRASTRQNGSAWQRAFKSKYQCKMQDLTLAYLERQETGIPVHEWSI